MEIEKTCTNCINFGNPSAEYICDDCMEDEDYPRHKKDWELKEE